LNKPVTILTGFLGAGKTTFLNHLLQENEGVRYAIIENEFGEQGIDNELVVRPDETIVELNNGCLCCTLNDNLYDILNELHERRADFDEIIIEATGVADPTGLAEPFVVHPLIRKHFPLRAIICLVDAELVEEQLKTTEEAINQITFSDILLINKVDLVDQSYVAVIADKLRSLNPLAEILSGQKDQFPSITANRGGQEKLEELLLHSKKKAPVDAEQLRFPVQKPHTHHHHKHTEAVNSIAFTFDAPFDFQRLHHQLFVYLAFQSKDLYRMKGLVWLDNKEEQYVIQSVGKRLSFQEKRNWTPTETRQSIIVFIGKQLQRPGLERILKRCISATYSQAK